jgi:hypothetical protein
MVTIRNTTLVALGVVAAIVGLTQLTSASDGVTTGSDTATASSLPFADTPYVLGDAIDAYASFMMSGGPPPDGIPSIDNPRFVAPDAARLDPGDMVIGYAHGGEARAYPQRILVLHEIVNDRVGGLNVAITYCPLTATAQGFKRGNTTLGVSGQLLNSNLVMFDRETRSFFSQIAATGLTGPHRGRTLDEVNLIWTTWARWRAAHPETEVLSERTGHLRNYNRDPYGSYNPLGGYYAQDRTMFPLMHSSGLHHQKEMVVGARTADRSAYFVMKDLARDRILATASFLAVYDPDLDTGYIYVRGGQNPDMEPLVGGGYRVGGQVYAADALPLEQVVSVEAFFFAWNAFYPDSETP